MYNNTLFQKFCRERNIKKSTIKGYISTLRLYTQFHNCTLEELINEAVTEEENKIPLKDRQLRERLVSYRNYMLENNLSSNTIKTYFSKLKTFYIHQGIQIPPLPSVKYKKQYQTNYLDLPTKEHLIQAIDLSPLPFKALILFMSSSGTAKAETLSLTVDDFLKATDEYYHSTKLQDILEELSQKDNIVPTLYLKRIKTDKYYYTFCSPEATEYMLKYLKTRVNLKRYDKLFPFSGSVVMSKFQEINDQMGWGFKGKYRFFRTHTLRKFHASNIQLSTEYIDALQGRSKTSVHESYIKTNPDELKRIYMENMENILLLKDNRQHEEVKEEIHITINVFIAEQQINL